MTEEPFTLQLEEFLFMFTSYMICEIYLNKTFVSFCCSCITEIYSISSTQQKKNPTKSTFTVYTTFCVCACQFFVYVCQPKRGYSNLLFEKRLFFFFCFPTTRPLGSIKRFVLSSRNALFVALWCTMHQRLHKQQGRKCERSEKIGCYNPNAISSTAHGIETEETSEPGGRF